MAIGTTAAILASTAISAGTALASGAQQAKAAKQGAQAVSSAADQSAATQRYIFDQTRADNALRLQAGDAATRQMSELMGLSLSPQSSAQPQYYGQQGYDAGQGGASASYGGRAPRGSIEQRVAAMGDGMVYDGNGGDNALAGAQYGRADLLREGPVAQSAGNALNPNRSATDVLRETPGYQYAFGEGMRGLNLAAGNRGQLNSGGAAREAIKYGLNMGDQNFGNYYNRLAGIAGTGQVAAGQNQQGGQVYGNAMTNINADRANGLASSYQNSANAWTNALGGAAGAGMWGISQFRGMK